jgi:hypothetical protein
MKIPIFNKNPKTNHKVTKTRRNAYQKQSNSGLFFGSWCLGVSVVRSFFPSLLDHQSES